MTDDDRTATHTLVDNLLALDEIAGPPDFLSPEWIIRLARELRQLRIERDDARAKLDDKVNELHVVEREFAEAQAPTGAGAEIVKLENALLEAVELVLRVGRRGFMTPIEHARAGALMRLVPQ